MPIPNIRYGVFHVDVRGTRRFVTGVGTGGEIAVNTYDGTSWLGWEALAFKSESAPFYEEYLSSKTSFTFAARRGVNESFLVIGASGTVAPFAILVSIGSNAVVVNKIIDTYGITFGASLSGKNVTVTFSPAVTTYVKVIG